MLLLGLVSILNVVAWALWSWATSLLLVYAGALMTKVFSTLHAPFGTLLPKSLSGNIPKVMARHITTQLRLCCVSPLIALLLGLWAEACPTREGGSL